MTQFTLLNKVLEPLAYNIKDSLPDIQCFFHSLEWGYFAKAMFLTRENTER
jgi:hypothetical protein